MRCERDEQRRRRGSRSLVFCPSWRKCRPKISSKQLIERLFIYLLYRLYHFNICALFSRLYYLIKHPHISRSIHLRIFCQRSRLSRGPNTRYLHTSVSSGSLILLATITSFSKLPHLYFMSVFHNFLLYDQVRDGIAGHNVPDIGLIVFHSLSFSFFLLVPARSFPLILAIPNASALEPKSLLLRSIRSPVLILPDHLPLNGLTLVPSRLFQIHSFYITILHKY